MTEPIFTGRCVRCGLELSLHDEFATVEQFAAMWLKVHACQGMVAGVFESGAAKHQADAAAHVSAQPNNGTRIDAICAECQTLGVKSKKGYPAKFWPKENGPDQCDGIDGSGGYLNHRRKPVTAS